MGMTGSHPRPRARSTRGLAPAAACYTPFVDRSMSLVHATHEGALEYCTLADLKRYAVDLAWSAQQSYWARSARIFSMASRNL
jgi:hypothetical protein